MNDSPPACLHSATVPEFALGRYFWGSRVSIESEVLVLTSVEFLSGVIFNLSTKIFHHS
jgi:hypothetical protein